MAISANSINGVLQVYAYKTIPSFVADMPPRGIWLENFDESVSNVGTSVTTRYATSKFATLNDLSLGWEAQQATSSAATATLKTLGHDHLFNVTDWATTGEAMLMNIFANVLSKQVANGITVNVMNNITSSVFTNTVTFTSSSLVTLTGSTSLQSIGTTLDNLEVPQSERYAIFTPNAWQALIGSNNLYQTLVYGDPSIVKFNGWKDLDGKEVNSSYPGAYIAGFNCFRYPRLNATSATKPYGGDTYTGNDKLIGFAGNKAALMAAARAPVVFNAPLAESVVVADPTSGFPLQFVVYFDGSKPGWRFGIYTLFGSSAANPNNLVEILSTYGS